jgi:NAD(P)-dependent dehydrogenase (short-subunit alcohol dehydrogenase family)
MTDAKKYTNKLQGSRVLVIGGSSGVGFAVAESCLEHGAIVFIASSTLSKINTAIEKLQTSYPAAKDQVTGIVCDLSNPETVEADIVTLLEKVGSRNLIDHIAFTAGEAIQILSLDTITPQALHARSVVRYYAPLFLAKHAAKYMTEGPKSSITLTTGANSQRPVKGMVGNNGLATAINGITRGLALDIAPIRVNCVNIGLVETPLVQAYVQDSTARAMFESKSLTGKIAQAEDVCEAYLYLMKDKNVTGTQIYTEGGALLK